jgi:environmental stress-induced protein Ves
VRDFNIMTARGQVEHHCERVSGEAVEIAWDAVAETLLCYCIRGTLVVKMSGSGEWHVTTEQSLCLPVHAARPEPVRLMLASHTRDTLSLLVRLRSLWSDRDLDETVA